jgi:hypothetical protein
VTRLAQDQEKLEQLRVEKAQLQSDESRLTGEVKTQEKQRKVAEAECTKRNAALKKAETERGEREQAVATAYEGAFDRAMNVFLQDEIEERIRQYEESLPQAQEQLATRKADTEAQNRAAIEDRIDQALTERYIWNKRAIGTGRMTGRPRYIRRVMGHRIDADFNEIIYEQNPDTILSHLGITVPAEQQQMRGYVTAKVIEIRQRLLHKGVNPLENQLLVAKPWFAEALPDMVRRNEGFRTALEDKLGESLDGEKIPATLLGRIKRTLKDNPHLVLMGLGIFSAVTTTATKDEKRTT